MFFWVYHLLLLSPFAAAAAGVVVAAGRAVAVAQLLRAQADPARRHELYEMSMQTKCVFKGPNYHYKGLCTHPV